MLLVYIVLHSDVHCCFGCCLFSSFLILWLVCCIFRVPPFYAQYSLQTATPIIHPYLCKIMLLPLLSLLPNAINTYNNFWCAVVLGACLMTTVHCCRRLLLFLVHSFKVLCWECRWLLLFVVIIMGKIWSVRKWLSFDVCSLHRSLHYYIADDNNNNKNEEGKNAKDPFQNR